MRKIVIVGILLLTNTVCAQDSTSYSKTLTNPCTPAQSEKTGFPLDYLVSPDGWIYRSFLFEKRPLLTTEESKFALAFNRYLLQAGSKLIILPIPNKPVITSQEILYDATQSKVYFLNQIQRGKRLGLDILDLLTPALENYVDPQTSMKFMVKTDFHWSSYGAKIAAKIIADDIKSTVIYQSLPKLEYKTTSYTIDRRGNLASDLMSYCDITVMPDTYTKYNTTRINQATDLIGDESPAIAIVGTSFSALDDFNFYGFVEDFTKLDVINYSSAGGGKYNAIKDFLKVKSNIINPPPFVIWEFPNFSYLSDQQAKELTKNLNDAIKDSK